MLNEFLLDILIAIFTINANLVFLYSIIKRIELRPYIFAFLSLSVGSIFLIFREVNFYYRVIGNIFYCIANLLFFSVVAFEEYKIFKMNRKKVKNNVGFYLILIQNPIIIIFIQFQIFILFITILILIMLLHVYLKKRTLIHISFLIVYIFAFFSILSSILHNYEIIGALEASYVTNFGFVTALFLCSIVAYFEEKLISSEKKLKYSEKRYKKAFEQVTLYKDVFTHDISNIIHSINSSIEIGLIEIKSSEDIHEIVETLDTLERTVKRGMRLIYNVRKLSDIEEGPINSLKEVDVILLLNEAIKYIENIYNQRNISVEVETSFNSIVLKANDLLLDIFENILHNAVKYNENNTIQVLIKITKEVFENKRYYKLEFIDFGIGIPDSKKIIIFQKGYQDLKGGKGMGFGLSLVSKIMQIYNGKIWIEDRIKGDYTKGTNFVLLLLE